MASLAYNADIQKPHTLELLLLATDRDGVRQQLRSSDFLGPINRAVVEPLERVLFEGTSLAWRHYLSCRQIWETKRGGPSIMSFWIECRYVIIG